MQAKQKATAQRKEIFKRAEQYVTEYRQEVRLGDSWTCSERNNLAAEFNGGDEDEQRRKPKRQCGTLIAAGNYKVD